MKMCSDRFDCCNKRKVISLGSLIDCSSLVRDHNGQLQFLVFSSICFLETGRYI